MQEIFPFINFERHTRTHDAIWCRCVTVAVVATTTFAMVSAADATAGRRIDVSLRERDHRRDRSPFPYVCGSYAFGGHLVVAPFHLYQHLWWLTRSSSIRGRRCYARPSPSSRSIDRSIMSFMDSLCMLNAGTAAVALNSVRCTMCAYCIALTLTFTLFIRIYVYCFLETLHQRSANRRNHTFERLSIKKKLRALAQRESETERRGARNGKHFYFEIIAFFSRYGE